jgi:2-succinyl-6-hydroxy-2,4-cyclohexadiene-1-carboxylate synthase
MDEMARDILGLMHHLDLERVHVVGSSLGAEVGLSLAAHYPEKVTSLVCDGALASVYGPYGTWEGTEAEYEEHVARQLAGIQQAPEVVYPSVNALVQAQREVFERYGWWNAYLEAVVRYGVRQVGPDKYVKSFGKQANAAYMEHYYRYRFEDYYRRVSCPILMLAEKEVEDARERAAMRGLKALAAQAEIAEIDGWAHPYCWLLEPEPAVKKVLEFLGK